MEAFLTQASKKFSHDTRASSAWQDQQSVLRTLSGEKGNIEVLVRVLGCLPHFLDRENWHNVKYVFVYGCAFNKAANFLENILMYIKYKPSTCYMEQIEAHSIQTTAALLHVSLHLKLLCYKQQHNIIISTLLNIENFNVSYSNH